jgi:hypothetical protein
MQKLMVEHRMPVPVWIKPAHVYTNMISDIICNAVMVEPTSLQRTNAVALEVLASWFDRVVPSAVKLGREEKTDKVRVQMEEEQIYFKMEALQVYMTRKLFGKETEKAVRTYLSENAREYKNNEKSGWWRCTWAIGFDRFNEVQIERWMNPE